MVILVTGSGGMLGSAVKKIFINHELILTTSIDLDVRNLTQVMPFAHRKIDIILHLAAETDLVKAELNPSDAYFVNATGTKNIVELAKLLDIPVVYLSTAGVFDGKKAIYFEDDLPNPVHHYGRSKYYGECVVREYEKHYIFRGGWGFGGGPNIDKKFVNKIYKQIKAGKKTLYGVTDIYGNPTYAKDLAMTIKNAIENNLSYGIYHTTGKGIASRYMVLEAIVNLLDMENKLDLRPVTCAEFYSIFPEQFTKTCSEVLSIEKLEKTGLSAMREWDIALAEYIQEFFIGESNGI